MSAPAREAPSASLFSIVKATLSKGLLRDVLVIASSTGVSRGLGLIRDMVIAHLFGAGAAFDAYTIAFTIPHMLRRLLAEGALSSAFVPVYTETLTKKGQQAANRFASNLISVGLIFFPLLVLVGILTAPIYIPFLADGFSGEKLKLTVGLTRVTFAFIAFVGMAAIFMGILNSHKNFFAPAFAPVAFNLGIIFAVIGLSSFLTTPIYSLAIGVLAGGLGMLLFQLPALHGKFQYQFAIDFKDEALRKLFMMMIPAVVGLAIFQINLLVDNKLASRLGDGAISALQYATRLFQLPLGVFAVAVASAILPRLSVQVASKDSAGLSSTLQRGLKLAAFIVLPAMAGLLAMGEPAIRLLFEHGKFTPESTHLTFYALANFIPGLVGYGLAYVLTRAFYAMHDTKTPMLVGALTVALNVALDYTLIGPMGVGGLALATSLAGLFNVTLLFVILERRLELTLFKPLSSDLAKMATSAALTGATAYSLYLGLKSHVPMEIVLVALPVGLGLLVYFGLAKLWEFYIDLVRHA
ncbi:murein biosynthesis integral membrane protein MurJ [Candidatus Acetothermia bacterium]|nr:murein biosynthesis integral membrane protein MurJ [Candidatus Acetothermia bacterium]